MTSEIAACGIVACAGVIFSNKKKSEGKRWWTRKVSADESGLLASPATVISGGVQVRVYV